MCILAIVHNCTIGAEKQGRGLDRQFRPQTQIGIHLAACPCVAAAMHCPGADERPVHKGVVGDDAPFCQKCISTFGIGRTLNASSMIASFSCQCAGEGINRM
jgi:hypothetical protein